MFLSGYSPLSGEHEIRLLELAPSRHLASPLRGHVYHTDLATPPDFEALSYVWGDSECHEEIAVWFEAPTLDTDRGGCQVSELPVGRNLALALRYLRLQTRPRILWVDAICINQVDVEERSRQVLRMPDIYRLASSVVAFLGPTESNVRAALGLLRRIGEGLAVDFKAQLILNDEIIPRIAQPRSRRVLPELQRWDSIARTGPKRKFLATASELRGLDRIARMEWFRRLWIRQEIGLGDERAVLQCGPWRIDWKVFSTAIFALRRIPVVCTDKQNEPQPPWRNSIGWLDTIVMSSKTQISLPSLRRQIALSRCADPRDRVYGILGFLRDGDRLKLVPDYTKTVAEVYTDAATRYIKLYDSLCLLEQCDLVPMEELPLSVPDLPSWVPDWTRGIASSSITGAPLPKIIDLIRPRAAIQPDGRRLRVQGMHIATVAAADATRYQPTGRDLGEIAFELRRIISHTFCYPDAASSDHDPSSRAPRSNGGVGQATKLHGDNRREAIARTLCAGSLDSGDVRTPGTGTDDAEERSWAEVGLVIRELAAGPPSWLSSSSPVDTETTTIEPEFFQAMLRVMKPHATERYLRAMDAACEERALFVTATKADDDDAGSSAKNNTIHDGARFGLGPAAVREGDEVCLLFGHAKPMVLRPCAPLRGGAAAGGGDDIRWPLLEESPRYRVVGEAYMDGEMDGEALLGPLPPGTRRRVGILGSGAAARDPRTGTFLEWLQAKGLLEEPTVEELGKRGAVDVLVTAGCRVSEFDLV